MERERLELAEKLSPIDVVLFILGAKEDTRMRMIILIWYLWSERNAIREENRRSAEGIARCVRTYSDEVLSFQKGDKQRKEQHKAHWCRPPENFLKLNCDASFISESGTGSWGFIIRDSEGDVVLTGRGKVQNLLSAFQAELIACLHGVNSALQLGISSLILETDACWSNRSCVLM
jgi:hypothetical protein